MHLLLLIMAVFNLLHPAFKPQITCTAPAVDGHEATNLIHNTSHNMFSSNKGFIAEHFIKPPVIISIEFPFQVDVEKIVLNSKVGAQCSTGFEVYGLSRSNNNRDNDVDIFKQIGWVYHPTNNVFRFVNRRFKCYSKFIKLERMTSQFEFNLPGSVSECELTHPYPDILNKLNCINLRIQRVKSGSTCCLKCIEIWGQPSLCVSKEVVQNVLKTYHYIQNPHGDHSTGSENSDVILIDDNNYTQDGYNNTRSQTSVLCNKKTEGNTNGVALSELSEQSTADECADSAHIPEEFLDSITLELLVLPMLLPSGHTVNQSTIEKYNEEEARWGRLPSDPFTAKPFSERSNPISNVKLKVRIDEFLLKNPHIKRSSMVIGRTNYTAASSTLTHQSGKNNTTFSKSQQSTNSNVPILTCDNNTRVPTTLNVGSAQLNNYKRKQSEELAMEPMSKYCKKEYNNRTKDPKFNTVCDKTFLNGNGRRDMHNTMIKKYNSSCSTETNNLNRNLKTENSKISTSVSCNTKCEVKNHKSKLSSSLDSALSMTLSQLPKFTKPSDKVLDRQLASELASCVFCGICVHNAMYRLLCGHLICRKCLVEYKTDNILCAKHDIINQTLKSTVVKVHT